MSRWDLDDTFSEDPTADLQAYTNTYLQREIRVEGAARDVPTFNRFLKVAAQSNTTRYA